MAFPTPVARLTPTAPVTLAAPSAGRRPMVGQGVRFTVVGTVATGGQLVLYALLAGTVGGQVANLASWFLASVATTAAHRRLTFRLPGLGSAHDHLVGLGTSLGGLLASALVLTGVGGNGLVHILGVGAATGVAGLGRFLVLAWWMRRGTRSQGTGAAGDVPVTPSNATQMVLVG